MRSRKTAWALTAALVWLLVGTAHAGKGYQEVASESLTPGARHLVWRVDGSTALINVGEVFPGSAARLEVLQAHDRIAGGLETTSSMCARTRGCLAAVNADFFAGGSPVGGVIIGNRMLRSPRPDHVQISLDPLRADATGGAGGSGWTGRLANGSGHEVSLAGVNVALPSDGVVLYTSTYADRTPACSCYELVAQELTPAQAGRLDGPVPLIAVTHAGGQTPLYPGIDVFAAAGSAGKALSALAASAGSTRQLSLSVQVDQPSRLSVGGHPVLLSDGRAVPYDHKDPMLTKPEPHTVIGWDGAGHVWLAALDGRQSGGQGLTADQTVGFLRRLGATDAVLEDGGGSTTFTLGGRVINTPSDGPERPVTNALALVVPVPAGAAPPHPAAPLRVARPAHHAHPARRTRHHAAHHRAHRPRPAARARAAAPLPPPVPGGRVRLVPSSADVALPPGRLPVGGTTQLAGVLVALAAGGWVRTTLRERRASHRAGGQPRAATSSRRGGS